MLLRIIRSSHHSHNPHYVLDMMKRILFTFAVIVLFFIAAIIFLIIVKKPLNFKTGELKIGNSVLKVEIADNPALWQRGLSGRENLGLNEGLLFIFPTADIRKFWMKDMRFPIDIVWIRENKIVGLVIGAEPEGSQPQTIYESPEPADMVLEINAGLAPQLEIKIGDLVAQRER
jgi:uncharacterized membrane protein (UPF0127 family)